MEGTWKDAGDQTRAAPFQVPSIRPLLSVLQVFYNTFEDCDEIQVFSDGFEEALTKPCEKLEF